MKFGSIYLDTSLLLTDTQFTVENDVNVYDILSIDDSTLNFEGTCNIPDQTGAKIINSTINITTACQLMPKASAIFHNSIWNIESRGDKASYALSAPVSLINSTILG